MKNYVSLYSVKWIVFLGILFFTTYGAVNHITAYIDRLYPVASLHFSWEKLIPFIPVFIIPYMSIDFLYGLAFFIIPKNRYSKEEYQRIIKGLGLQLLWNQIFTLICFLSFPLKYTFAKPEIPPQYQSTFNALLSFDLPYNQAPSLHISLMVILMVFYSQHIKNSWIKNALNIWFVLIGLSTVLVYQHHSIDILLGLFCGLCSVLMWNEPIEEKKNDNFHKRKGLEKGRLYHYFSYGLITSFVLIFILPILGNFNLITYHLNIYIHMFLWWLFLSFFTVFKIKFYGHSFPIRNTKNHFTILFKIIASPYLWLRNLFIYPFNFYQKNIQVLPELWIGNIFSMRKEENKNMVFINLAWEMDNLQKNTRSFPMLDLIEPTVEQIMEIVEQIDKEIHTGKKVYLHCALGIFRTIYTTGSYLIIKENKTPKEVMDIFYSLPLHEKMKAYLQRKDVDFLKLYQEIEAINILNKSGLK